LPNIYLTFIKFFKKENFARELLDRVLELELSLSRFSNKYMRKKEIKKNR